MARTGRPRGFSRAEAVDQAMHLFWQHGYEATSLAHLRQVMGGISSASFYAAFESKEALFKEAIALYGEKHGACLAPLFDAHESPRHAIEHSLRCSVDMQTGEGHPLGCLVCSSTSSCSLEAADVQRYVAAIRQRNHQAIRDCVDRAIREEALSSNSDAQGLAATFNGFLLGISAQARDGVDRSTLQAAVSEVMRLWQVA